MATGRSPHGECGLKSRGFYGSGKRQWSLPAWGVWIEISDKAVWACAGRTSLPAWGVWIEIDTTRF